MDSYPGQILDPEAGEEMYLKMERHVILPRCYEASTVRHRAVCDMDI